MKKFTISLFVFLFCLTLHAQEFWFEAGLKGGVGMSFLYNKNVVDDSNWDYALTPMFGAGAKFSCNFGPYHGVFLEGLFNKSTQDFRYNIASSTEDFDYSVEWQSIDLYVLYRGIKNRVYFEVGPMYSLIQKFEQPLIHNAAASESTDFYENSYFGGVFGFGGYIAGAETFSVGIGVRLNYGFGDIVNDKGLAESNGFPNPVKDIAYETEERTNIMFAQFLVEFNFGVGRFAKTACSERFKRIRRR
ncbi:MAG: outer membrane beta-barrel protein [Bacteroidota bacterium]